MTVFAGWPDRRSGWRSLAAALVWVTLACLVSKAVAGVTGAPPIMPYYGAVALSLWLGGISGAVAATLLSIIAFGGLVVGEPGVWGLTSDDIPRVATFVLLSGLVSALSLGRDRAEAELRASERRFRTMLATANEGVWLLDREGRTQYLNDRMSGMLGAPPSEIAAHDVLDFVFPEDIPTAQAHIASILRGESSEFEFRLQRQDGAPIWARVSTSPVRNARGRVSGMLGLFTDMTERRRTEEALNQANERFALAADAVQSLIYDWDLRTGQVTWSSGLYALLGYLPEEAGPTPTWWTERVHASQAAQTAFAKAASLEEDRFATEYRLRHRDGHWVSVWDQGRIMRNPAGAPVRVIGSVIDITARTEAEDALRLLNDAGRALASSLDYKATLRRVAWIAVPRLADWCLVDLADTQGVLRRVAVAHADPGQRDLAGQAMQAAADANAESLRDTTSLLIERADDAEGQRAAQDAVSADLLQALAPLSVIVVPLSAGGKVHGSMTLMTTAHSDRHLRPQDHSLAEQLARRSAVALLNARLYHDAHAAEARYRGLVEGAKDGILVVDPDGICVDINPALTLMTGFSRQELVGSPATRVASGGPWDTGGLAQLRAEGQWLGEFTLRRRDGQSIVVESQITQVALPNGPAFLGVLRDVTERRRFADLQEEFLSSLAHDLKNPLTTVRGQTQLWLRRLHRGEEPDAERLEESLQGVAAAALRMTYLLDELADVMRLRAGQEIELQRHHTDLVALARRSVAELKRTTERHELRLLTETPALTGEFDGPRLERVLVNLLSNAIKYSPAGGVIAVRVSCEAAAPGSTAVISVTDPGVGIPEADLERIFERFQRGANVRSIAGTGIGLSGARRIVELHGGSITVASVEGEGSTFTVRLPLEGEVCRGTP
ncbi:MAG: PAS domain S-box protein [Thermomicrobiales bacterium]|nr:PAS domain S-box protein [Thermomicrobiales bacterium]